MTEAHQLHTWTARGVTLEDLLAAADDVPATDVATVALIYAPRFCVFGRMTGGGSLEGPPGFKLGQHPSFTDAVRAQAYEIKLFCAHWELRWLRDGMTGAAAMLADDAHTASALQQRLGDGETGTRSLEDPLDRRYLLWGKVEKNPTITRDSWTALTSNRIGRLWVPLDRPDEDLPRIRLKAVEYLETGPHGNVAVVDQRLTGFEAYAPKRSGQGDA